MSKLPKLKIKAPFAGLNGSVCELEDFEHRFNYLDYRSSLVFIVVEGKVIRSYEELLHLAEQDPYRNKEFLEVRIVLSVMGGG